MCLSAALCVVAAVTAGAQDGAARAVVPTQPDAEQMLTNLSVIKLARAKFSDKVIVAVIESRPARFDLSPDRLVELKRGGVSERVILAMLARERGASLARSDAERDPEDDAFFEGLGAMGRPGAGGAADAGSVNIFGSSGGVRGRTRSDGVNGGVEGESQTTGSATVRIIRPQEQGGASAPKLERTPTLTNQSVVEMVEAGFSEGTIVRRIENSPADFDLSPAKLEELRRRRVTEPIVNAMRAAMSEDAPAKPLNEE
jgi:hypothetical protein